VDNNCDINGDGYVTSLDVLLAVNDMNVNGARELDTPTLDGLFLDVTSDNLVTPGDILAIIDYLNKLSRESVLQGEGEASPVDSVNNEVAAQETGEALISVQDAGLSVNALPQAAIDVQEAVTADTDLLYGPIDEADPADLVFGELGGGKAAQDDDLDDILSEIAADVDGAVEADSLDAFFSKLQ
jgi:hypothetical protein